MSLCLAENAIRPFALGRRNWLFADTVAGANASAANVDSAQPCSLLDLDRGKCRWPLEFFSAGSGDLTFCGNTAPDGISYCAGHARMAYRAPARRSA